MEIILKNSITQGLVPHPDELAYGELAINYGKGSEQIFFKNENDEVLSISVKYDNVVKTIVNETPSSALENGTYFNTVTDRIETWAHKTGQPEVYVMIDYHEVAVNDIIYAEVDDCFYIWDGTALNKIITEVPTATNDTLGVVKGGGNVDVGQYGVLNVPVATSSASGVVKVGSNVDVAQDGTISVPQADYNKLGLVKGSDENEYGASSGDILILSNGKMRCRGGILRYHRLDWLDANPDYWEINRYNSLYNVLSNYDDSPKMFMKNGVSPSQIAIVGNTVKIVFINLSGADVLKTTYTVKPNPDNVNFCIIEKEVTVDNNRVLNYDGLNMQSGNTSGQISDAVNGIDGLFEAYELLPNIESVVSKTEPIYTDYPREHYRFLNDENLSTQATNFEKKFRVNVDKSKTNPTLSIETQVLPSENVGYNTVRMSLYKSDATTIIGSVHSPSNTSGSVQQYNAINVSTYVADGQINNGTAKYYTKIVRSAFGSVNGTDGFVTIKNWYKANPNGKVTSEYGYYGDNAYFFSGTEYNSIIVLNENDVELYYKDYTDIRSELSTFFNNVNDMDTYFSENEILSVGFVVKVSLTALIHTEEEGVENNITFGLHKAYLSAYTTENSGGSPSFTYDEYVPLSRPTLTVKYTGGDGELHLVTYTSFYAKCIQKTVGNDTVDYAMCVAESVSSVFGWIFSNGDSKWKFAIGSDYNTVKNKLLSNVNNASSGVEPVEPGISGGGNTPGQSEQGGVRP